MSQPHAYHSKASKLIGAFDAKTHFSELLQATSLGQEFTITRHGQKVAMLIPFQEKEQSVRSVSGAIRAIKNLRSGVSLGKKTSIKQLRSEGRK